MSHAEAEEPTPELGAVVAVEAEAASRVVRHRRHRFPARDKVVKVRYDDRELAVLAAAADRAGLTVAGFLAGAGLSVAGQGPPPSQTADQAAAARQAAELLTAEQSRRSHAAYASVHGLTATPQLSKTTDSSATGSSRSQGPVIQPAFGWPGRPAGPAPASRPGRAR